MREMTLVVLGGLCNRLRALLSARWLCQVDPSLSVRVVWEAKAECAARYDELFETSFIETEQFRIETGTIWDAPAAWRRNLRWPKLLRSFRYAAQYADLHPQLSPAECLQLLSGKPRVYVATGCALCHTPASVWKFVRPRAEMLQRIEEVSQHFDEHTIGVHIRRTDNLQSIAHSPLDVFVQTMRDAVEQQPKTRFFVATDDEGSKAQLTTLFPQRIITLPISTTRSTLDGMRGAVEDLFLLSRTHRLIGSYWSSFTDLAAEINHIPLTIATRS